MCFTITVIAVVIIMYDSIKIRRLNKRIDHLEKSICYERLKELTEHLFCLEER